MEIRMIWWMCGYMRLNKIGNKVIREKVGVAPIEDKMREIKLRWFGHVKMRDVDVPVKRCEMINLSGYRRGRERPNKKLERGN